MLQPKDTLAEWIQKQDPYILCYKWQLDQKLEAKRNEFCRASGWSVTLLIFKVWPSNTAFGLLYFNQSYLWTQPTLVHVSQIPEVSRALPANWLFAHLYHFSRYHRLKISSPFQLIRFFYLSKICGFFFCFSFVFPQSSNGQNDCLSSGYLQLWLSAVHSARKRKTWKKAHLHFLKDTSWKSHMTCSWLLIA